MGTVLESDPVIDGQGLGGDGLPVVGVADAAAQGLFVRVGQGAGHQGRQFAGQVRDITAPEIPLLWQVHFPVGRDVGHQHGQAEAHGLQQSDGQPLVAGREHKQPGIGKHLVMKLKDFLIHCMMRIDYPGL